MGYMEELRALVGHRRVILNGSVAVVRNGEGKILLQLRDDGRWGLPGGLMELGESCEETARRETKEETGLDLGRLTLLGVWSGTLKAPDAESLDFAWAELSALPENLAASHRRILTERREAIEKGETPCDSYPGT